MEEKKKDGTEIRDTEGGWEEEEEVGGHLLIKGAGGEKIEDDLKPVPEKKQERDGGRGNISGLKGNDLE